jgi:methylated-DNA-[protein]-cysteine S-methyltransferase
MSTSRTTHPSPVGELTLVASDAGLVAVLWPDDRPGRVPLPDDVADGPHPVLEAAATQLAEFFAGTRTDFALPLAPAGTPFQRKVWDLLATVPHGTTTTYGELAAEVGGPSKARAVGAAVGRNPLSIVVPCHRVVGASGALTGFAGGLPAKRWLLAHEAGR